MKFKKDEKKELGEKKVSKNKKLYEVEVEEMKKKIDDFLEKERKGFLE